MTIIVDSREPETIKSIMRREKINFEIKKLPTFDYIINEEIGIERKCYPDLVGSVVTRRLYAQLDRIVKSPLRAYILIEGHISDSYRILQYSKIQGDCRDIARGALITIAVNYNIPILYAPTQYDTVEIIKKIEKKSGNYNLKVQKPVKTLNETAKVLTLINGVGSSTAMNIVEKCGKKINKYTTKKLMQTKGVGKKTAQKIMEFIEEIIE